MAVSEFGTQFVSLSDPSVDIYIDLSSITLGI